MATAVRRIAHSLSRHEGRDALEQQFRFEGEGASAGALAELLSTAPLIGAGSIFGNRLGAEMEMSGAGRHLAGFSPAPGFRFDVDVVPVSEAAFLVRFSQPERRAPYLAGEFLWTLRDDDSGAVFDEQINTEAALQAVAQPLGGERPSLRRWLFFRVGHERVMTAATGNLAGLLDTVPD